VAKYLFNFLVIHKEKDLNGKKGWQEEKKARDSVPRPRQIFIKIKKEDDAMCYGQTRRGRQHAEREEKKKRESSGRDFSR